MATFSQRFKRVPGSGTKKHYIDTETGEEVSYRQALNRSKAAALTRNSLSPERRAAAQSGAQRYHKDVRDFADRWNKRHKKNKISYREAQSNLEFKLEQKIKRRQRITPFSQDLQGFKTLKQASVSYERAVRHIGYDMTGRSVSRSGVRASLRPTVRFYREAGLRA